MVLIPKGIYVPFFKEDLQKDKPKKEQEARIRPEPVKAFLLDRVPVTVKQFREFLKDEPSLRKSTVSRILADSAYLKTWKSDLPSDSEIKQQKNFPVTHVSWFIARKYCKSLGKRLPTIAEWEYASLGSEPSVQKHILHWYQKPSSNGLTQVGQGKPNRFGLQDMHGLIWEWVEDFSSTMIGLDSRSQGERTEGLFCGAGSIRAKDATEYATFMRHAFRSGLAGNHCIGLLGFRCASDIEGK